MKIPMVKILNIRYIISFVVIRSDGMNFIDFFTIKLTNKRIVDLRLLSIAIRLDKFRQQAKESGQNVKIVGASEKHR